MRRAFLLVLCVSCAGVPSPVADAGMTDAGFEDAGAIDAGSEDAGRPPDAHDGGRPSRHDGGNPDGGVLPCGAISSGNDCCPGLQVFDSVCVSDLCQPLTAGCQVDGDCCEGMTCEAGVCTAAGGCCQRFSCDAGACRAAGACVPAGALCDLRDPEGCCGDSFCTIDWLDVPRCFRSDHRVPWCAPTYNYSCHSDLQCCGGSCEDVGGLLRCSQ